MRKINILTEDYIRLEELFGRNEDDIETRILDKQAEINESLSKYYHSDKSTEDYLELRYSPIFEELVSYGYKEALSNFSKNIINNNSVSLKEANDFSYVIRSINMQPSSDSVSDCVCCFGSLEESDIPEVDDINYRVVYTESGKNIALKNISKLQESVVNAFKNLKSINSADIRDSLHTLAEIYILTKND